MRSYLTYFKLRCITNLQYRAAALAGMGTQFFFGLIFIMVYLAFYDSNPNSELPMNVSNLVTYMWLQQAFYSLVYPYEREQEFISMITNGNIAYELVRPQSFYFKWFIKLYSKKVINVLLRFAPIIIIGFLLPAPYTLAFPASFSAFILFLASIFLSSILITGLLMVIHLICIFTLDIRGAFTIYAVIAEIFMGGTIPIPFFPNWLKEIAYKLPFRYVNDFPFRVYSLDIGINEGLNLLLGSFIWIIIVILIGLLISKLALKKAVVQGG